MRARVNSSNRVIVVAIPLSPGLSGSPDRRRKGYIKIINLIFGFKHRVISSASTLPAPQLTRPA
jgi:hypothetical protein